MDDLDYFEVLEFLKSNNGLNHPISISPLITKAIPVEPSFHEYSTLTMRPIRRILGKLEEDGNIIIKNNPSLNGSSYVWDRAKDFIVELTQNGNSTLEKRVASELSIKVNNSIYDTNESVKEVNKSIIDTNKSVIDTGRSVVDTNTAMVNISTKQTGINEKIADNSKVQTDILKSQRFILWASVFVAACSALISYLSYRKDVPSNQLKQELKVINTRIDTLMQRLPQTKNIPPIKKAMGDSTKKKN